MGEARDVEGPDAEAKVTTLREIRPSLLNQPQPTLELYLRLAQHNGLEDFRDNVRIVRLAESVGHQGAQPPVSSAVTTNEHDGGGRRHRCP